MQGEAGLLRRRPADALARQAVANPTRPAGHAESQQPPTHGANPPQAPSLYSGGSTEYGAQSSAQMRVDFASWSPAPRLPGAPAPPHPLGPAPTARLLPSASPGGLTPAIPQPRPRPKYGQPLARLTRLGGSSACPGQQNLVLRSRLPDSPRPSRSSSRDKNSAMATATDDCEGRSPILRDSGLSAFVATLVAGRAKTDGYPTQGHDWRPIPRDRRASAWLASCPRRAGGKSRPTCGWRAHPPARRNSSACS